MLTTDRPVIRSDWSLEEVKSLLSLPFNDLMFHAQQVHRLYFDPNRVQLSTLLSVKTGACPEDCKYCPQSARYNTGLKVIPMMALDEVLEKARQAKAAGSSRFCMGFAWRHPRDQDMPAVLDMVEGVRKLGMETCVTMGMLSEKQACQLASVGLDYYNHNLDSSPEFYGNIITTRTYSERLQTLAVVREAGIRVCSGGILGMGESRDDRAGLLYQLARLPEHPENVSINLLVRVEGTPLAHVEDLDPFEFVRCVAASRILMPKAYVRLSAGRREMNDEMHALLYMAGANGIFIGEKLLVTPLPETDGDLQLLQRLGIEPKERKYDAVPEDLSREPCYGRG